MKLCIYTVVLLSGLLLLRCPCSKNYTIVTNLATPKVTTKFMLLFNKPASVFLGVMVTGRPL
jgi:hypothetical protein